MLELAETTRSLQNIPSTRIDRVPIALLLADSSTYVLNPGKHILIFDAQHGASFTQQPTPDAMILAHFSCNASGLWLCIEQNTQTAYVNGRPIRQIAFLRPGDAVCIGTVHLLLRSQSLAPTDIHTPTVEQSLQVLRLRGLGGKYHGRCFDLDQPCLIGRHENARVSIDDPTIALHHARITVRSGTPEIAVCSLDYEFVLNGHSRQHALLSSGDQLMFSERYRFLVESALMPRYAQPTDPALAALSLTAKQALIHNTHKLYPHQSWPWLVLTACILAALITLLLVLGAR